MHLKEVIKTGNDDEAVTTIGFGSSEASTSSASVHVCYVTWLYGLAQIFVLS